MTGRRRHRSRPSEDAAAAIQRLLQEWNIGLSDAVNGSVRGRARRPGSARDLPAADANRGARIDISRRAGTPRRTRGQVVPVDAELPCGADEASPFREAASTWLSGQPNGPRRVGFPWQPLTGVVRISTYEKTLGHPLTPKQVPAQPRQRCSVLRGPLDQSPRFAMSPCPCPGQPSGRSHGRTIIIVIASALLAGGCSAVRPVSAPGRPAAGSGWPASASAPPRGITHFTVTGTVPVEPNPSQDTHAQAEGAACQPQEFRRDETLGEVTAAGLSAAGAPAAAALLKHFLAGTGTEMRFGARSQISQEARASRAFQDLNRHIQDAVASQLRAGQSRVRLTGPALRTIRFGLPGSSQDLYLGFRGTQGLDIHGTGTTTDVGYSGSLTYVIRDSYGFPPEDQLLGIGTAMRYLQVNCGNPPTRGGARWFPDTITVAVALRQPGKGSRAATPPRP